MSALPKVRKTAIPTLGFPTQKDAVIALYEQGHAPSLIAHEIGASRNSVTRAIHDYRVKTGRMIPATQKMPQQPALLPEPRYEDWRMRNYRKAVSGARMALEAMGQ